MGRLEIKAINSLIDQYDKFSEAMDTLRGFKGSITVEDYYRCKTVSLSNGFTRILIQEVDYKMAVIKSELSSMGVSI